MKLKYIFLLLLFSLGLTVAAQQEDGGRYHRKFDIAKVKKEKEAFLIKKMELTAEEAKVFIPVESEYMDKKFALNREIRHQIRDLKRKKNKTEEDYKKINDLTLEIEEKNAALKKEYYDKFEEILPAQKVVKYRSADQEFMTQLLKEHKSDQTKE